MKLFRFQPSEDGPIHVGLVTSDNRVLDLTAEGISHLALLLEENDFLEVLDNLAKTDLPTVDLRAAHLISPVERQEVWAAGVTYLRSKEARMDESNFSAQAYDKVYNAPRPELFFKSLGEKVSGPGDLIGIRTDARWQVPEPELALVMNSRRQLVGVTIGNDMSARDIEGENLLYLPQAKIYTRSCALGPFIVTITSEAAVRQWQIQLEIHREGRLVFEGACGLDRLKRSFYELADYLWRSQHFPHGVVLLTGTCIVPPNDFTLQPGDSVKITIPQIGTLENEVVLV